MNRALKFYTEPGKRFLIFDPFGNRIEFVKAISNTLRA
jgi:hypothetical protein